jgi:integrase
LSVLQLDQWKTKRLTGGLTATTVNRELAFLRSALTKAVDWEFITEHPMRSVKQLKVDEDHRVRFLSDMEEARIRAALNRRNAQAHLARERHNIWLVDRGHEPSQLWRVGEFVDHISPMILLSINTGLRRGELFKLLRSDIDLDSRQLKVRAAAAKSGKSRFIPLNDEAADVVTRWTKQHPGLPDELVFPGRDGKSLTNVDSAWHSILAVADVKRFRWHDLRHHFASRLVMAGVDLNTVRELLGHADLKMTLRYAHLAPQHKAQAVAKLLRAA